MSTFSASKTPTQERTVVTVKLPIALAELLDAERKASKSSLASLARTAVDWHRGTGLPRHPGRPPVTLPADSSGSTVPKSMLLDPEQIEYLDRVGARIGHVRTGSLILILLQYLGIEAMPAVPSEQ